MFKPARLQGSRHLLSPGLQNCGSPNLRFAKPEEALAAAQVDLNTILSDDAEIHSVVTGIERVVVRTPQYITSDKIKGVYPFARKQGMSLEDFQDHWWHRHGPIAALTEAALSYIQVHGLPESYDQIVPVYDGITEISWTDAEAAGRAIVSRQMTEDQGSDAPNFVDMDSIALFLAQEETIIAP
jgi:hypothetical protein